MFHTLQFYYGLFICGFVFIHIAQNILHSSDVRTFFDSAKFSVTSLRILFLCLSLHFFSSWNSYYGVV